MRRLRYSLLLLLLIVGGFLNIERVDIGSQTDIVNLNTAVYFVAFIAVFSVFLIPDSIRPSSIMMIIVWVVAYLIMRITN